MEKVISGVVFIHAKRANFTSYPYAGDHGGAVKFLQSAREHAYFELLNNTINIDKLLKRFMGQTNDIFHYNSVKCQDILKNNIIVLSKFIENKNFF